MNKQELLRQRIWGLAAVHHGVRDADVILQEFDRRFKQSSQEPNTKNFKDMPAGVSAIPLVWFTGGTAHTCVETRQIDTRHKVKCSGEYTIYATREDLSMMYLPAVVLRYEGELISHTEVSHEDDIPAAITQAKKDAATHAHTRKVKNADIKEVTQTEVEPLVWRMEGIDRSHKDTRHNVERSGEYAVYVLKSTSWPNVRTMELSYQGNVLSSIETVVDDAPAVITQLKDDAAIHAHTNK